jgi:hypothetical protein
MNQNVTAVMQKYDPIIPSKSPLCHNHIAQLTITDNVPYKTELLDDEDGKPPVIPVLSVPVFRFENSLVPASRVPMPVSVIPVFHIIFHINLIKKRSRQGPPAGITDKYPRITDQSPRQAQLLKFIKTGITETGITGVGTRGAETNKFRGNRN